MLGQSSNLRPNLGAQSPRTRLSEEPFPTAGSCPMYHPPPCRGRSLLDGKKVLLIDEKQTTRDTRANVLRSRKRKRASVKFDLLREASKRITRCRSSHFALLKQGQRSTCLAYDLALLRTQIPEFKTVTVA